MCVFAPIKCRAVIHASGEGGFVGIKHGILQSSPNPRRIPDFINHITFIFEAFTFKLFSLRTGSELTETWISNFFFFDPWFFIDKLLLSYISGCVV